MIEQRTLRTLGFMRLFATMEPATNPWTGDLTHQTEAA